MYQTFLTERPGGLSLTCSDIFSKWLYQGHYLCHKGMCESVKRRKKKEEEILCGVGSQTGSKGKKANTQCDKKWGDTQVKGRISLKALSHKRKKGCVRTPKIEQTVRLSMTMHRHVLSSINTEKKERKNERKKGLFQAKWVHFGPSIIK